MGMLVYSVLDLQRLEMYIINTKNKQKTLVELIEMSSLFLFCLITKSNQQQNRSDNINRNLDYFFHTSFCDIYEHFHLRVYF